MADKSNSNANILVIDDDEAITGLIKTILSKDGYSVHTAGTGTEGFNLARSVRPDIILMDITMPDMDGYEATQKIKADASLQNIPVIFLTGKSASEDGGRAFATGGLTYMRKPFTAQQLRDLITLTVQALKV